jgi:tRNA pseudouridine 55 synthase
MLSGFINLYKESGLTSQAAVSRVIRILKDNDIQVDKAGHLGTLDPDGEGVLPIALGRAARLFDFLSAKRKAYYTEFVFGSETDTLDSSGKITRVSDIIPKKEEIEAVLKSLTGKVMQAPPDYSAKSVGGVKAYKLARAGKKPDLKPKEVDIYSIKLLFELENSVFSFQIECGGGVYIRSIARDLGLSLGSVAHMRYIKRTASGPFKIENAYKLDRISAPFYDKILPVSFALQGVPSFAPEEKYVKSLLNGVKIQIPSAPEGTSQLYIDGELIGLTENKEGRCYIKTRLI